MRRARRGNRDAAAVAIARDLSLRHGADALGAAIDRQGAAIERRDIARADLYCAVCTVLADRDEVFTRWRARLPDGRTG